MYVVLYDQAGRLSVDKRVSTKQLKNNYNYIHYIHKNFEGVNK